MATMTGTVVSSDVSPAYDSGRDGAVTLTTQGRLRVDASGTANAGPLPAGTDRSGTTDAGAKVLAPANVARLSLTGQNISAGDIWINEIGGTATVGAAGSYKIGPGVAFAIATNRAVSVIGGTGAGQAWTATET